MMDLEIVKQIMWNWVFEVGYKINHCPPEAKVVTGNQKNDAQLHYFETDSGLELTLTTDFRYIEKCNIVDEQKFIMFVLRWA
jgi:hypothetical protein